MISVRNQIKIAPEWRVWVIVTNNVNPVVWNNTKKIVWDSTTDNVKLAIADNVWQALHWTDE